MANQHHASDGSRSFFIPVGPAVGVIVCLGCVLFLGQFASDSSTATQLPVAQSEATQQNVTQKKTTPQKTTPTKTIEFTPKRVCPAFPPIVKFPIKKVDQVGEEISPFELVLGVTLNGNSRAYPINMLTGPRREIINDTLGGRAIAATW